MMDKSLKKNNSCLIMQCLVWLLSIVSMATGQWDKTSVRLPNHYTAMERDLEVAFVLIKPNAFTYNTMIHLEYLPDDAILPAESKPKAKAKLLSSLPVPLGITRGSVVFPCGLVKHAGPHRAFLTVNGQREAESDILQVAWTPVSITAPTKLRMYSADVALVVAFTRSLCKTFKRNEDIFGLQKSKAASTPSTKQRPEQSLGFTVVLDLIECSRTGNNDSDCQAPTLRNRKQVWFSYQVPDLYAKSSFTLTLNCSVWGRSGAFRLFLRTDLSHAAVIATSSVIQVDPNPAFLIKSVESDFVFPCLKQDIKPFSVKKPRCQGLEDRIRVFGQTYQVIGGGNSIPSQWVYLGEKRIMADDNLVFIPCDYFSPRYWNFCFHYVTISLIGTTDTITKLCLPAKNEASSMALSHWNEWNEWSQCSRSCGTKGTRSRYRVCQAASVVDTGQTRVLCEGPKIEYKPCHAQPACDIIDQNDPDLFQARWQPLFMEQSRSPCGCGCIYIVNGQRRIQITSSLDCLHVPRPLRWQIKVNPKETAGVTVTTIQPSCLTALVKVKDGNDYRAELINKFDFFHRGEGLVINSSSDTLTFEFEPDHESCQINMELSVVAIRLPVPTQMSFLSKAKAIIDQTYASFPIIVLFLVSFVMVITACCFFLLCHFEYKRKKYVAWKSQPSSGYSTPTATAKNYIAMEDIETAGSSLEDLLPPVTRQGGHKRRKQLLRRIRASFVISQTSKRSKLERRLSLPTSPFLTRRAEDEDDDANHSRTARGHRLITSEQVKRALAVKSRRYARGDYRPLNRRAAVPASTPLSNSANKRQSKSLSDILETLGQGQGQRSRPRPVARKTPVCSKPDLLTHRRKKRYLSPSNQRSTLQSSKLTVSSSLSRTDSQDTLKPMASDTTSSFGGDAPELELDLYDYNLENVVSGHPTSFFAPPTYIDYDATPTVEDFEMTEIFRSTPDVVRRRRNDQTMVNSRTSDLTESVTSADLKLKDDDNEEEEEVDDEEPHETDSLLSKKKPYKMLNLTHIDDDISYADSSDECVA